MPKPVIFVVGMAFQCLVLVTTILIGQPLPTWERLIANAFLLGGLAAVLFIVWCQLEIRQFRKQQKAHLDQIR